MVINRARLLRPNGFLALAAIWILAWVLPWAAWLEPLPWVRMGIALLLFAVPGVAASLLLAGERFTLAAHFVCGLALSVMLVGSLGVLGRILHFPFAFMRPVVAVAGLAGVLALAASFSSGAVLYKRSNLSLLAVAALAAIMAFAILVNLQSRFFGDDTSYLAYLTNWQHAQPLNFREVVFGQGRVDPFRFWLAMFPMNLAFLAQTSGLPGLLVLGLYVEPFFIVLGLLAAYSLYEDLLPSGELAVAAVLLQVTFLYLLRSGLQPGTHFFADISHDKSFAAFVLAPGFFLLTRYFLDSFTPRSTLYLWLAGVGLGLTHPVILAYAIFISGLMAAFTLLGRKEYRRFVIAGLFLVSIIVPSSSLRVLNIPWVNQRVFSRESAPKLVQNFDLETAMEGPGIRKRITYLEGTRFYGFRLERVQLTVGAGKPQTGLEFLLSWSYLWVLAAACVWSLLRLRKSPAAPLIAAASFLVLLAAIPYTGWLLGYFVTARMLHRTPWLFPIGLAGVAMSVDLARAVSSRVRSLKRWVPRSGSVAAGLVAAGCVAVIGYYSAFVYGDSWQSLRELGQYKGQLEQLVALGKYLERTLDGPARFIASANIRDYLPGITPEAKLVFFRYDVFTPYPVNMDLLHKVLSRKDSVTVNQRIRILDRYDADFVLVKDPVVKEYYARHPESFRVHNFEDFWLIEYLQDGL